MFYSIAGEGGRAGEPTIFIRLAGCNLVCPWCDTAYHPQIRFHLTADKILDRIRSEGWPGRWICLTGGEPMMQDSAALSLRLRQAGYSVQIETNGTYPIPAGAFDFVTISPKLQREVPHDRFPFLEANEQVADEFKYVISRPEDLDLVRWGRRIYLQPNYEIPEAREICVQAALQHPEWRLSLQIHKMLGLP